MKQKLQTVPPYLCRKSYSGPAQARLKRHTVPQPERGAGTHKGQENGQRCSLHLGDRRGQVHAAILPHRILALL